jgi:hypothetical protein
MEPSSVNYRLKNKHVPTQSLCLTAESWHKVLQLALDYGWVPFDSPIIDPFEAPPVAGTYLGVPLRIVPGGYDTRKDTSYKEIVFEDALNLADALERAFDEYEPLCLPGIYYLFDDRELERILPPSIGVLTEVILFCQSGPFSIETW